MIQQNTFSFSFNSNSSCRGCYKNLASNDPASINQKQKIIQKTVRINSSLYTMNIAGLNVYQAPATNYQIVEQAGASYVVPPGLNWNQMSDRSRPSNQHVKTSSGSTYGSNSLKRSKVRDRPGAMSPGGIGVDIKHNSYERYLNRIKGKGLLKRGNESIGPNMTGGKNVKLSIVDGCNCSPIPKTVSNNLEEFNNVMYNVKYSFSEGEIVLVRKNNYDNKWYKGTIIIIDGSTYTINFDNCKPQEIDISKYPIIPYVRVGEECLKKDPANLLELLQTSDICAKEQLLEAGIFV